jgi:hypothetical protein
VDLGSGRQAGFECDDLRAGRPARISTIIARTGVRVLCGPVFWGISTWISGVSGIDYRLSSVPVLNRAGAAASYQECQQNPPSHIAMVSRLHPGHNAENMLKPMYQVFS